MSAWAVSLVCLREATKIRVGLLGEWVAMAVKAGLFMVAIRGQYCLVGKPLICTSKGTGLTAGLKLNNPACMRHIRSVK